MTQSKATIKRWAAKESFVYMFDLGFDNLYKIGLTREWKQRLSKLSAANPRLSVVAVAAVHNKHHIEKALHQRLKRHRVERELFELENPSGVIEMMNQYGRVVYPAKGE